MESILQLFSVFCAYKKYMYFIKSKFFLLGYFLFSLLAFCKLLDVNSHFMFKIVCGVCDGTLSYHYSHTLICYRILVALFTFK
jgi:hypothetical protein